MSDKRDTIDNLLYFDDEEAFPDVNSSKRITHDIDELLGSEPTMFGTETYDSVDKILDTDSPPLEYVNAKSKRDKQQQEEEEETQLSEYNGTEEDVSHEIDQVEPNKVRRTESDIVEELSSSRPRIESQMRDISEENRRSRIYSRRGRGAKNSDSIPRKASDDDFSKNYSKSAFSIDTALTETDTMRIDTFYKVVVLGESGVGKSNLLIRWMDNKFINTTVTLNAEVATKIFKVEDKIIKIQLWDTAGQEQYRAIMQSYYRASAGAILVYDITRPVSFRLLDKWLKDIKNAQGNENTQILLIGNKADLDSDRQVTREEGIQFAKKYGLNFMETSALSGHNVNKAFQIVLQDIYNLQKKDVHLEENESAMDGKKVIVLSDDDNKGAKSKCSC